MIKADIEWARQLINKRLEEFNSANSGQWAMENHLPPAWESNTPYGELFELFRQETDYNDAPSLIAERLILVFALCPYLDPSLLEPFTKALQSGQGLDILGGVQSETQFGFMPTLQTVLFIVAGSDIDARKSLLSKVFNEAHPLWTMGIIDVHHDPRTKNPLLTPFELNEEFYNILVLDQPYKPQFSRTFPAQLVQTREDWDDMVAPSDTRFALEEINIWLKERERLAKDEVISRKAKRGYRALFYGPSGTGKTMAACLLGKEAGLPVYRVDLSMVVSKYIGETEKNLSLIFEKAENKEWILFFDEADALFGKRTQVSTSNDRYANQEVSYLLQRIEDFNGLVILSSNFKANIDSAFTRRFQSIVKFTMPNKTLRLELFGRAFEKKYLLEDLQLMENVANKYELSGAEINNVFQYCAMMCLHKGVKKVSSEIFSQGVIKELRKKGKAL
ncbi:ATP-binding protein [Fulvivirga ulvae]|uniref:ATP-binding protein n=1 Tax=Fulvivirga ulvae TaxID=2904245 RepID=UPI001F2658E3|nr:ATP-binding protein [Fulvivirga ulvae]UII35064.1 ATP-binding protein [Fulvivirga ulvae]